MPIFGQVWLWSSAAFLLGALLCWLLVARPARNRVGELEAQLATRARRPSAPERRPDLEDSLVPGLSSGTGDSEDFRTRSYRLQGTPPPPLPPERGRLAPYVDPEPANRDFPPQPPDLVVPPPEPETELAERPSTAATQYLDVSSGSLTAPPEVPTMSPPPSDRGWFDDELEGDAANKAPEEQPAVPRNRHHLDEDPAPYDGHLVDDGSDDVDFASALDDEPRSAIEDESGGTVFTQRTQPVSGELIRQIDEAGKQDLSRADNLVDDLAEEPGETEYDRRERTVESEAVAPPGTFTEPAAFTEPERSIPRYAERSPDFTDQPGFTEPERSPGVAGSERPGFTEPERSFPGLDEPERSESGFTEPERSDFAEAGFAEPSDAGFPGAEQPVGGFTESERSLSRSTAQEPVAAFTEPESSTPAFTEPESVAQPVPPEEPAEQTEVVSTVAPPEEEHPATRSAGNLPKRVPQKNRISQGAVSVRVEPTPSALPKRVPGKPRHQVPFGVLPSSTPEPAAVAADAGAEPEAPRSLFEPIVPAEDEGMATPPPPHRLRQGSGGGRGPFGPGSAMPLPGGASPSPEFTIKASVAALRYCTPESPQFGRTVAEVWFRTAADAERVGFRPVG